jgi:hypothetical protein
MTQRRNWSNGEVGPHLHRLFPLFHILLRFVFHSNAILVAQSRRNCEIPGSSWVPCIWGEPLKSNKGVVIYTLYRNSPTVGTISGDDARIHVATFDAAEDKDYNKNNCETARDLFASQPGVTVRYWCEHGKFTQ